MQPKLTRMKRYYCSLLLMLCLYTNSFSQKTSLQQYDSLTIQHYGDRYMINNMVIKKNRLEPILAKYDVSNNELNLSKKYASTAGWLGLATIGFTIAGITQINKSDALAYGFVGAGLVANFISIPIQLNSKRHLDKAIWLYNRSVLQ
jgi:hypothetical protein